MRRRAREAQRVTGTRTSPLPRATPSTRTAIPGPAFTSSSPCPAETAKPAGIGAYVTPEESCSTGSPVITGAVAWSSVTGAPGGRRAEVRLRRLARRSAIANAAVASATTQGHRAFGCRDFPSTSREATDESGVRTGDAISESPSTDTSGADMADLDRDPSLVVLRGERRTSRRSARRARRPPSDRSRAAPARSERRRDDGVGRDGRLRGPGGVRRRRVRRARTKLARLDDRRGVRRARAQLRGALAQLAHDRVGERGRNEVLVIPSASRTSTRATLGGREGVRARREADVGAARSFGSGERSTSTALASTSSPVFVRTAGDRAAQREIAEHLVEQARIHLPLEEHRPGDAPSASASTSDRAGSGVEKSSADSDAASSSTCSTLIVRAPVVTTRAARATATGRASCAVSEP